MKGKLSPACSAGDRNHTGEDERAIVFVSPLSLSSCTLLFFRRPRNRLGGRGEYGKNAVAHPIPCGNFSLRVSPIRPAVRRYRLTKRFRVVVVHAEPYRATPSRRDMENRSVARKSPRDLCDFVASADFYPPLSRFSSTNAIFIRFI